jgi:tRNA-dihydrouridine synthase B
MDHAGEPAPRVVQLAGADCEALALAARMNVDLGAQIIDINMGCPAKKVCGRLCGSALLQDEALVGRILDAVVRAVDVPVTLKIRTGWDPTRRNGARIASIAQSCGIAALAVHGRTRADFFQGAAEYDTIRDIKSRVSIPVFANGDVGSAQKAREVLDFTGADGVMIGRAAQGAPWIFGAVNAYLCDAATSPPLARAEVRGIILEHLESLYAFYGEAANIRRALMATANTAMQFALARSHLDGWVSGSAQAA